MFRAETLDHVAFPVRDLPRAEKFYLETVGLTFLTQRKNADGSPRHTYVKAGENIVGLTLPGVAVPASASGAPRYAIAMPNEDSFEATVTRIEASGVKYTGIENHSAALFYDYLISEEGQRLIANEGRVVAHPKVEPIYPRMKELQSLLGTPRIQLNTLEQNHKLLKEGLQILDEIVLKRKAS